MQPNPHFLADLVTFTEEILNGKLHFLCSVSKLEGLIISRPAKKKLWQFGEKTDSFQYPIFGMALKNAGVTSVRYYHLGQNIVDKLLKLKVQSCTLYNSKYLIASSTQIINTETFAFISVLVFELLSRKVLFINR